MKTIPYNRLAQIMTSKSSKPKAYILPSCSTCQRILAEIGPDHFTIRDIRNQPISAQEIERMAQGAGSYEALFSRRAMKFRELDLGSKDLTEADYKTYILEHDTFLKRPVFVFENDVFVGNSKKTTAAVVARLEK